MPNVAVSSSRTCCCWSALKLSCHNH